MENKAIKIDLSGIGELQQLLREALELTEQLQMKLNEISNRELDISIKTQES